MKPVSFWLLTALALGFGLRLYGLARESLWLDEATSILLAQSDIPTLIRATAQDIHPPVYYLLLHFWVKLGASEFIVRALSACLGTLSIAVIFALGRCLFDEWVGVGSAWLLAVSPLHVWYSQETRMYVLVTLWTLAGSFWLWRALRAGGKRRWLAYVLCMALGLYTHYHTVFILLFQNVFFAWYWIGRRERGLLRTWVMAQAGILLLFAPWLPVLLNQIAQGGGGWVEVAIGNPAPRALIETWIDYSLGTVRQWYPPWLRRIGYLLLAVALLSPFVRIWLRRERREAGRAWLYLWLYWALSLAAVWGVSQVKPMYAGRYLLPFLPPYLILLAAGCASLPQRRRDVEKREAFSSAPLRRCGELSLRNVSLLALSAICLVGVALTAYYPQKDDWRGTAQYVLQAAQASDVVAFVPLWNYKPFDYYARGKIALFSELPVPLPEDADLDTLLGEATAGRGRLWLIWTPAHYADPRGRVQRYCDERFRLLQRAEFRGVGWVSLYEIR
jgi:uncharacterized membrane protein